MAKKTGSVRQRNKKWYYSFDAGTIDGKRKRIERVCDARTQAEAWKCLGQARSKFFSTGIEDNNANISFNDVAMDWLEYKKEELKPNTIISYRYKLKKYILPKFALHRVEEINAVMLNDYFLELKKAGTSKGVFNIIRIMLKGIFNYAAAIRHIIQVSPMNYASYPSYRNDEQDECRNITYSPEQLDKILQYAANSLKNYEYIIIFIAIKTGLRIGEILALDWRDINMEKKSMAINKTLCYNSHSITKPKSKTSSRTVYFDAELLIALQQYKYRQNMNRLSYGEYFVQYSVDNGVINTDGVGEGRYPIITAECGRQIWCCNLTKTMGKISKETGIKFTFHSLRHTHATLLLQAEINMKTIQMRLGHSRIETTMNIYATSTAEMDMAAAKATECISLPTNCRQKLPTYLDKQK